jgi:hypothetical protein
MQKKEKKESDKINKKIEKINRRMSEGQYKVKNKCNKKLDNL